jgi:hypothetical protein
LTEAAAMDGISDTDDSGFQQRRRTEPSTAIVTVEHTSGKRG